MSSPEGGNQEPLSWMPDISMARYNREDFPYVIRTDQQSLTEAYVKTSEPLHIRKNYAKLSIIFGDNGSDKLYSAISKKPRLGQSGFTKPLSHGKAIYINIPRAYNTSARIAEDLKSKGHVSTKASESDNLAFLIRADIGMSIVGELIRLSDSYLFEKLVSKSFCDLYLNLELHRRAIKGTLSPWFNAIEVTRRTPDAP